MKNILLRCTSGIVYIGVIIAGLVTNQWAFVGMCALFTTLAIIEFSNLCNHESGANPLLIFLDVIGGLIMVGSAFSFCSGALSLHANHYLLFYVLYLIARMVVQLYIKDASSLDSLAYSFMGQLYVAMPLALMNVLYFDIATPHLLLAMFIMIWLNDTGAFIVGCSIGRHRLFPRISPKKSWEGFWGGMVFAVGSAFIFHYIFPDCFAGVELWQLIGLGVVVSAFATWGDLIESLIKRTLGVKDSGKMIPGHGGILDRIDSLLLVVPAMVCYFIISGCFLR